MTETNGFAWVGLLLKVSHILAGVLTLVSGCIAIVSSKGGTWHRRAGRWYVYAMLWITLSSFGLLLIRPNLFLFGVAMLTGYLTLSGYRVTPTANARGEGRHRRTLDWIISLCGVAVGIGMTGWSVANLTGLITTLVRAPSNGELIPIPTGFLALTIFFGAMLLVNAVPDAIRVIRPTTDRRWWWFAHMNRMIGGYIAAISAFLVQNVATHVPLQWSWLIWIAPTVIGLPLLGLWIRRYQKRFSAEDAVANN